MGATAVVGEDYAVGAVFVGEEGVFDALDSFDDDRECCDGAEPGDDFPICVGVYGGVVGGCYAPAASVLG